MHIQDMFPVILLKCTTSMIYNFPAEYYIYLILVVSDLVAYFILCL
jgi:hypothetical protein